MIKHSTEVTYGRVMDYLDTIAPLCGAEEWDNCGLLVGAPHTVVTGIVVCLDIEDAVLDEAHEVGANLVVAHHPLLLGKAPLCYTEESRTTRLVARCIREGVGVIAVHTNYDMAPKGVSYQLGKVLGLKGMRPLVPSASGQVKLVTFVPQSEAEHVAHALFEAGAGWIGSYSGCSFQVKGEGTFQSPLQGNPFLGVPGEFSRVEEVRIETVLYTEHLRRVVEVLHEVHPYEEVAYDVYPLLNRSSVGGAGIVGELPEEESEAQFIARVKRVLGLAWVRHSPLLGRPIRKVAACGGSGMSYFGHAQAQRADVYLTGDLRYHDYQRAEGNILLMDGGHYETERVALPYLRDKLLDKFSTFAVNLFTGRSTCMEVS